MLLPNKMFYDVYSTHPQYKDDGYVYIVLRDAKIYTRVKRSEMFDRDMFGGCFLQCYPQDSYEQAEKSAIACANRLGARFVEPDEFIAIEKGGETNRVARAFATAEKMIAMG